MHFFCKSHMNKLKRDILPPIKAELDLLPSINRFHSHACILGPGEQSNFMAKSNYNCSLTCICTAFTVNIQL